MAKKNWMKDGMWVSAVGLVLTIFPRMSHGQINWLEDNKFVHSEYSQKISMDFKEASLNDVLKIFSQQSGMNFIAADDISGRRITMFLDQVPVEEALEKVLEANGLTYEIQPGSDIFIVKSKLTGNLITRVYALKHASVPSSKLNSTFSISGDSEGSSGGSASSASGSSSSGSGSGSSSGSRSSRSGSGAPGAASGGLGASGGGGTGIISALQGLLTERGKIIEDPRTNSLIITDEATQFPIIEETLARLDVPIPQILIEVEMLDISKVTSDKLGIRLGEQPLLFRGASRQHVYPWNQNELQNRGLIDEPEYSTGTLSATGLTAALQFLRTQTDTKNLARPRILTLNNETAQIQISTDEAIGILTTTASSTSPSTEEAERTNTGVFLTVTPQANLLTGEITMAVTPRVIVAREGNISLGGNVVKDPEERGMKSLLKIQTGETIILGGLLRENDNKTITKLPFLGDIPLIGGAFRHKDSIDNSRELIIFMTPHILNEENKQRVKPAAEPMQALSREQDIPQKRLNEVDKELDLIEEKL